MIQKVLVSFDKFTARRCINLSYKKRQVQKSLFCHVSSINQSRNKLLISYWSKLIVLIGTYLGLISWQNINPKSNVKTVISESRKTHPIVLHIIWLSRCLVPSGVKENNSIGVGIMHSFSFLHDVLRWLY